MVGQLLLTPTYAIRSRNRKCRGLSVLERSFLHHRGDPHRRWRVHGRTGFADTGRDLCVCRSRRKRLMSDAPTAQDTGSAYDLQMANFVCDVVTGVNSYTTTWAFVLPTLPCNQYSTHEVSHRCQIKALLPMAMVVNFPPAIFACAQPPLSLPVSYRTHTYRHRRRPSH